jgi:hypothetical protein
MALTEAFSGTETVTTTEHSLTTDTAGPDAQTDDGVYQVFLDLSALADGDTFRFAAYEKVLAASTQRRFFSQEISNAQGLEDNWVSPSFLLLHGWDFTLVKVTGTDRSIDWSIRKVA